MKKIAILYHSAPGPTERSAGHVAEGTGLVPDTSIQPLPAQALAARPDEVFDGSILGSLACPDAVSVPIKSLTNGASGLRRRQQCSRARLSILEPLK